MNRTLRKVGRAAALCTLASATGCMTLATDPLSPPPVRHATCAAENVAQDCVDQMSPEYQTWIEEVKHCYRDTNAEFHDEYGRTNRWPEPYTTLSFHAVRQPLGLQVENARLQMLSLWDYHFESGTGKLTVMGRNRLESIVEQADSLGHVIYVNRSPIAEETATRIIEVRREIKAMSLDPSAFEIAETRMTPSSVSGGEAAKAMTLLTSPPKLGSSSGSSSQSGGGSGGSQGGTP